MQRYVGPSNWNFLTEVCAEFPNQTILGSGDLFCAEDCVRMIRETGVSGVTAARGAIGNPWIFSQAKSLLDGEPLPAAPTVLEQKQVIQEHLRLALKVYSEQRAVKQLRKFGMRYADWHPEGDHVRAAFIKVNNLDQWNAVFSNWYKEDVPGIYPTEPGLPKPPASTPFSV